MVTPGLLPEADDRRPSSLPRWIVTLLILSLLGFIGWQARDHVRVLARLEHELARAKAAPPPAPQEDVGRLRELEARIAEFRKQPPPLPPPPAAEFRILPPDLAGERLTQGLNEFRAGRYAQAEACFLRAVPEGYLYLVLTCLARGDVAEAAIFLEKAMAADPRWLKRVRPRDLFGSAEEFDRTLKALEERLREQPLDLEAKTLLAYLHYHEKGAEYAKALLTEVATARPDHPSARAFLEAVEKP